MEPLSAGALLGISAAVSGISSLLQAGNTRDAANAIEAAVAKYGPDARAIIEQNLGGPSAMAEVYGERLAPEAAAAERNVLQRLQQISERGYTPEEQAALNRIQQQSAAQAAQQEAALRSQMARRGVAGSGQELAMNLANLGQQSAAQYQAGLDVAANAQRRALEALRAQGQFGQSFRGQAFDEAQARAAANEAHRLNRAQMLTNVAGQELAAKTGGAQTVAGLQNQPWQQLGGYGSVATQAAIGAKYGQTKKDNQTKNPGEG